MLADIDSDGFDVGTRTNVHGTFYGMKHQIPAMLATGGGVIVNLASVAGVNASSHLGAYVSAKAAIIALSKPAALDYADRGVRINVVAAGPILTDHIRAAGADAQRQAAAAVPLGRIGTVDDVAASIVWLCSDQASFVTGVTLPVDGARPPAPSCSGSTPRVRASVVGERRRTRSPRGRPSPARRADSRSSSAARACT